jgi:AraC-like DNA-binding protein
MENAILHENARGRVWIARDLDGLEMLDASFRNESAPRHSHQTYAVGMVHYGANRFSCRGTTHIAPAGTLCTVTVGETHTCQVSDGMAYRCLYPDIALLNEVADDLAGRPADTILALPPVIDDPDLFGLVGSLFAAQEAAAPRLTRQSLLLRLVARVVTRHAAERPPVRPLSPDLRRLARVRDYLAANLTSNISLEDLAMVADLRRFRLLRSFAKVYGLPPHAYLTQLRIWAAKAMILDGTPLAETAAAVGFADQSHLSRHFRKIVGVTPGRYRAARERAPTAR